MMRLLSAIQHGEVRVGHGVRLVREIASGSYGLVCLGVDRHKKKVAVKLEMMVSESSHKNTLFVEAEVLRLLQGYMGVPKLIWKGTCNICGVDYNVMITQLLSYNLEQLFNLCGRKFSLKTTLMLADQMVSRVEFLHTNHFVHRDIKPDNFMMGLYHNSRVVHLVDYGLAKRYRDRTDSHRPCSSENSVVGNAQFASINTLNWVKQSRRDDLEALGYMFVYFLKGSLPWQNIRAVTHAQSYEKVYEMKMSIPIDELCKDMPTEFADYLKHCRGLKYEETPDYPAIRRNYFRELFKKSQLDCDWDYDWSKRLKKDDRARKRSRYILIDKYSGLCSD